MFEKLSAWLRKKREDRRDALLPERQVIVRTDDQGISASYPDGEVQSIAWNEIDRIAIETNDSGPWGADFWWLFEGEGRRCAYPQGAMGEMGPMDVANERFPGFNWEALIQANTSVSNARFVCWERES